MGCCDSKNLRETDEAELFITNQESKLCLSKIRLPNFYKIFERYNITKSPNKALLEEIFINLKIDVKDPVLCNFFRFWYLPRPQQYNKTKIMTSAVLLCDGTHEEKVAVLYNTFKDESSGLLTKDNIKCMVQKITEISMKDLVCFAQLYTSNRFLIEKYKAELEAGYEMVISYYIGNITESVVQDSMGYDKFSNVMALKENTYLLVPSYLRHNACKLLKTLRSAQSTISQILSEIENKAEKTKIIHQNII